MSIRILAHRQSLVRAGVDRARELSRLRDREASLVTVVSEAPRQLAIIRTRIAQLEEKR